MGKNAFGGGNENFLYTPMSEDEREVIARLIEKDDLEIHIDQWGVVNKFKKIQFGDKVLKITFEVLFRSPDVAIPVYYFDMSLQTRSGIILHKNRYPTQPSGLWVGSGLCLPMELLISIHEIDPKLVKAIKPGARGLTNREGNRKLDSGQRKLLEQVRAGEKNVRDQHKKEASIASKKSLY